ncbi:MAG TPA: hypothetical protein VN177_11030 [Myxococcales bacterium]|jgi:hypothetical protein|nr:hypothetical protein [Myxococcales bacterium]
MTLRKWITFASAAALIAGASACTEKSGTSTSAGQTPADNTAQGRRGDTLPRARDAGVADTATGSAPATGSTTTPSDSTSSGSSSGSSDTTKK